MKKRSLSIFLAAAMLLSLLPVTALASESVSYLACDENGQSWRTETCTDYTAVTDSDTAWSAGWYVATGTVTLPSRVTVTGDVRLILTDGCHLTADKGIAVNGGNTFTVYCQSGRTGALTAGDPPNPDGNSGGAGEVTYLIGTAAELKAFADAVNGGQSDACGKLTADIDLGGSADNQWTPIGKSYSTPFTGTFDGQGHTVSGLYFDAPATKYAGLFGCMKAGGTIRNLGVTNAYVNAEESVGGVCGESYGAIQNCWFSGSVAGSQKYVGGVCGVNMGTISGCYNTGAVSGNERIGGVCGTNGNSASRIDNCFNTGAVSGNINVGGVCGYIEAGVLENCFNTGTVAASTSWQGGVCGQKVGSGAI